MPTSPTSGVSFEELAGSPRVAINQQGVTATRMYKVAWADWQPFARDLVGTYRLFGTTPQFISPIAFPGMPNLVVESVTVEPFDDQNPDAGVAVDLAGQTNTYSSGGNFARLTAVYKTNWDANNTPRGDLPGVPAGTVLTYATDLAAEYLAIPGRTWKWSADGTRLPDDINPGVLIPTGAYALSWDRVPRPPWTAIRQLRGKVNSATFLAAAAGTVLFLGAKAYRKFQFVQDDGYWQLDYHFAESVKRLSSGAEVGWNYFYRETASAGEHWLEIQDADGNKPYQSGDFTTLFAFG